MAGNERFDDTIGSWLQETAPNQLPGRVLTATFARTRRTRQEPGWGAIPRSLPRFVPALTGGAVIVVAAVLAFNIGINSGPGATPTPTYPTTESMAASPSVLPSELGPVACRIYAAVVLDCTRDGTLLLIQKDREHLFIRHADGSEIPLTEQLPGFGEILRSAWPGGATISPDGSRVVFAGRINPPDQRDLYCEDGALFGVKADGGPADVLWESPGGGSIRYPTFSPDGTRIAFADGRCDVDHTMWIMNADGSDAHQIVSSEVGRLDGTHVLGLAWSAAGDRIGLLVDEGVYSFAPDGSDFRKDGSANWGF